MKTNIIKLLSIVCVLAVSVPSMAQRSPWGTGFNPPGSGSSGNNSPWNQGSDDEDSDQSDSPWGQGSDDDSNDDNDDSSTPWGGNGGDGDNEPACQGNCHVTLPDGSQLEDRDCDGLADIHEMELCMTDPCDEDSDDDGLLDGEEVIIVFSGGENPTAQCEEDTDPNEEDTDGDTVPDGEEENENDTDPTDPDTDGDGMDDGEEQDENCDPNDQDTDDDGIPDGDDDNPTTPDDSDDTDEEECWTEDCHNNANGTTSQNTHSSTAQNDTNQAGVQSCQSNSNQAISWIALLLCLALTLNNRRKEDL